ncbi:10115_t:CDS:1 [Funneliformis geosporum]|uniref:19669_t:CDS:1 n=1 Tax=Funneliformis geosporum TaxID=1117311 RepID=A0A9W4SKG0_9GLOM|nr:19669_t:CDS:1 [Funneliformis geosporum]CAI2184300.1 10115_t:CDS:1 [Funneliformis geosporum]
MNNQLNYLLRQVNYNTIKAPDIQYVRNLISQVMNGRNYRRMTGRKLLKRNVILEANRVNFHYRHIINLATNHFWSHLTVSQRNQFTTLANRVNFMNPNYTIRMDTLLRISQLTGRQETTSEFADMFYHGSSFP